MFILRVSRLTRCLFCPKILSSNKHCTTEHIQLRKAPQVSIRTCFCLTTFSYKSMKFHLSLFAYMLNKVISLLPFLSLGMGGSSPCCCVEVLHSCVAIPSHQTLLLSMQVSQVVSCWNTLWCLVPSGQCFRWKGCVVGEFELDEHLWRASGPTSPREGKLLCWKDFFSKLGSKLMCLTSVPGSLLVIPRISVFI